MPIAVRELKQAVSAMTNPATQARTYYCITPSPIGELLLAGDGERLSALSMEGQECWPEKQADWVWDQGRFREVLAQLAAYFAGEIHEFDLPLAMTGSVFQLRVWEALRKIPYGTTISYGELAARVGDPKASRAVGLANGRNRIGIIVPCHRVIGANGALNGYAGGLENKRWLLEHEGALLL